jgi:hypothetical protein
LVVLFIRSVGESIKETMNSPLVLRVQAYQGDGLSFVTPSRHETRNVKLDGKDYPDQGPNARPGSSSCSRRVDEHTLEVTDKVGEKIAGTREIRVSPGGNTRAMTIRAPGRSKPDVLVFDRD